MSDLIERETVLAFVRRCKDRLKGKGLTYEILVDYIESIPSAERKGEWIRNKDGRYFCDKCGCVCGRYSNHSDPLHGNRWNYYFCPNCGADMRGEDDGR